MFKKFKEFFSNESLLDTAYTTTVKMLEYDHEMYTAARAVLRETDGCELPFDIRKLDRKVNKYEREVRRNVLTHLAVAGTQNLVPGLVLVSIVISVERIGDFTKNIAELARDHEAPLKAGPLEGDLVEVEETVGEHFPAAIEIMDSQNKTLARKLMQAEKATNSKVNRLISTLSWMDDGVMPLRDAVCIALYARYLKRINAHLSTIASSIVNPFARIGFKEKKSAAR